MSSPYNASDKTRRRQAGFSLFELIVVIVIISILAMIAMSGYSSWLMRTKSEELVLDLKRSISYARSSAIRHGGKVRLCGSDNSATCTGSFDRGWIVFNDFDDSGQLDNDDTLIRVFDRPSNPFSVSVQDAAGPTDITGITFSYKGYADVALNASLSNGSVSQSFTMTRAGYIP